MNPALRLPLLTGLLAFALALAARAVGIVLRPVWLDEALTQHALSLDWADMVAERIAAGHSPAYFLLMKAIADPSAIGALRLAGAIMDSAAAGLLAAALARGFGLRAGLFAAGLYALDPLLLYWGQNARPYGMMMLFLALAVFGAMGLIARAERPAGGDAMALSLGLAGAGVTLTGGALAASLVALAPFASARLRGSAAFRAAWGRALILPALCIGAMALWVSLPHAGAVQGIFWTTRYAPFTLANAGIVALEAVAGDRAAHLAPPVLGSLRTVTALGLALLALLGVALATACRSLPRRPALLPLAALAFGLPALLLCLSLSTSLLVARYFLPAVAAALMLAAVGLADLAARRNGWLLAAAIFPALALLALNQSLSPGWPRNTAARQLSDIIYSLPQPGTRLLLHPDDSLGRELETELLIDRPGRPGFPQIVPALPEQAAALLARPGPAFLAARGADWKAGYAPLLPPPACLWETPYAVLAYWADGPVACPKLSG